MYLKETEVKYVISTLIITQVHLGILQLLKNWMTVPWLPFLVMKESVYIASEKHFSVVVNILYKLN